VVRGARLVVAASTFLADEARKLGAAEGRVISNGVEIPDAVGAPDDPPHVLYVGRLSEEKGVLDFVEATDGLPRVIVGDGPLRDRVPETVGFVAPADVGAYYERAAVVCVPSHREGYGMTAREAMAYRRAVVATDAGGLADAAKDGVTALVVPSADPAAIRAAVERLLGDAELRAALAGHAHAAAVEEFSPEAETRALADAYSAALART